MSEAVARVRRGPMRETDMRFDDRFVPIRSEDLATALGQDTERFGASAGALGELAAALERISEQQASMLERAIAAAYVAYNPDRDTLLVGNVSRPRDDAGVQQLRALLAYVLEKANFQQLSDVELVQAVQAASSHGVVVRLNPALIESVDLWVRGRGEVSRTVRTWRKPLRGEQRALPVFRRLALVARLRNDPHLYLKLFKEIPIRDVEALLPHAEVVMSWQDRLIVYGGGSGTLLSMAWKLITGGVLVLGQLLWVVLVPLGTVVLRVFLGYRNTKKHRVSQRTTNLYFQNLSNNAGTIHSLISMICQEETKEALLLYAECLHWQMRGQTPQSLEELDRGIESWLHDRFAADANFDAPDACETLDRLGLWENRAALRVMPPAAAAQRVNALVAARSMEGYHLERAQTAPPSTSLAPAAGDTESDSAALHAPASAAAS